MSESPTVITERITSFDASTAAQRYAELLSQNGYVERVVLEETPWEGRRLWAVLDAPPFRDEYRDPIYAAQERIIDELAEAVFDFRLVNVNELESPLDTVLPAAGHVLYERPARG